MEHSLVKSVVLGFSGGVDSFYCAYILKKHYHVIPVFLKINKNADEKRVLKIARSLNLNPMVIDVSRDFNQEVVKPFINNYKNGLTPNPCALCNREIKFKKLYDVLVETNSDYIATGHYARVAYSPHWKKRLIYRGLDRAKEQSYFLSLVDSRIIQRLLLPLGQFDKAYVVESAISLGYPFNGESYDICFLKGRYQDFLRRFIPQKEGSFILNGSVVGKHKGIFNYTVGQRKGIGISYKEPLYIISIDPLKNLIFLGTKSELKKRRFKVKGVNWQVDFEDIKNFDKILAQVRYRSKAVRVEEIEYFKNGIYDVKLETAVKAVAPGQICAFYANDLLLGGGEIMRFEEFANG